MFYPALLTACSFPEKPHFSRGSEQLPESPEEQRGCAVPPESGSAGSSPPAHRGQRRLFPQTMPHATGQPSLGLGAHVRLKIKHQHISEIQHSIRALRAASIRMSGCKKIRPLAFARISLIVEKCLEEKCHAYVSADTCRSSDECGTLSGFTAVAVCMGHPLFNHEL